MKGIIDKYRLSLENNVLPLFENINCLPVTVIMPVKNYANKINLAIDAILQSDYPGIFLTVVNDGSTDETLKQLIHDYQLHPIITAFPNKLEAAPIKAVYESNIYRRLRVIDKDPYDKIASGADAINAGLNICKTPLFMTIDSDTIIEANTISAMIFSYLTHPHCIAVGGNIYIPDGPYENNQIKYTIPKNINIGVQVIEYLRSFFYGHEGWSKIGGAMCHSGACTLFEKRAVLELGGFDRDNYSYDSEIIMNLHHFMRKNAYPYSIAYAASAIAWSSQIYSLQAFWNQRNRWQRGLWRSFLKHIGMMFNPRYGQTGMLAFPFYFFYEILGPVVEGSAYLLFLYVLLTRGIALNQLAWFLVMAWSFLYLITVSCVLLNYMTYQKYYRIRDLFHFMGLSFAEIIFFRPFRGINAVYSSLQFAWNRLWGKCL
ncbi:MAG: glycosyltransferase [Gammaproteobacteria bacterium]|nr:glycosyltransferase [Gammaproteobacteria bacterium]